MVFGIYCRKSVLTDKGESVENQLEMCREYIRNRFGDNNKIIIYEDEGYSGKNTARPMFRKMTEDIKKLDYVVCYRLDRLSRSVSDFSALVEMMNRNKTGFICIKEEFDTSKPMGKAMMYIASVFSQLERETIGERVRDNMLMLAKTGRWLGGNTPLGYSSVREAYTCGGRTKYACFLKSNGELETVERIFKAFEKSESLSRTTDIVNDMELKTKNGLDFTNQAVKDILSNPVYCRADKKAFEYFENRNIKVYGEVCKRGLISYNKNDDDNIIIAVGKHLPIISGERWIKIQEMLRTDAAFDRRGLLRGAALASGAIICGLCGEKMYAVKRSGGRGFDYICRRKRRKEGCLCKNLNGVVADEKIKKFLKEKDDIFFMKKEIRDNLLILWDGKELSINFK
ncbi:MAG: recombinase family protein [Clostridiales bacterium]|nr:recombinase family protein [Clostridiales bacterium]